MNAPDLIRHLSLLPHPEGGYYRETYRAAQSVTNAANQPRSVSTAIYFLLDGAAKSHFHRIKSDELWFFHQGQPLEIVLIQDGQPRTILLGHDFAQGAVPQAVIPADTWFGARVRDETGFGLVSCTVAPGFDFADFELADRAALTAEFPYLRELVAQFTMPAAAPAI